MSILVKNVTKRYGSFTALDQVTVEAPGGQLTALLGPSGGGKTTLLRIIAGLEVADAGTILFEGEDATERTARDRNVGFVFQHYALFKHMTIFENVAFGLRVRKRPQAEIEARVHELLKLIQLDGMGRRYPSQLSGGQRQRVALARALAARPKVLLLDEPFGALDAKVRKDLRRWLRRLHEEIHVTSIFVTHDQEEALEVADRVVIMNHGKIEQEGTPEQVYNKPASPFVLSFLGHVNVFHGRGLVMGDRDESSAEPAAKSPAYARPHEIDLVRGKPAGNQGTPAHVVWVNKTGATIKVELKVEGSKTENDGLMVVELSRERYGELNLSAGDLVWAVPREVVVFGDWSI